MKTGPSMKARNPRSWLALQLSVVPYPEALELQHRLLACRIDGILEEDLVLILEHPPVFTLGRRGGLENLRVSREFLEARGILMVQAERGGNITYHGPGQLVIYPIIDLQRHRLSISEYVDRLEEIMIQLAVRWGVNARRRPKNRGVWVGERKLGSVGVAVRKNVAFHGLAFNAALDPTPFSWIRPCGLSGVRMTSVARETGAPVPMDRIRKDAVQCLESVFGIALHGRDIRNLIRPEHHEQSISYSKTRMDTHSASPRIDF